jgi:hypothetical protein
MRGGWRVYHQQKIMSPPCLTINDAMSECILTNVCNRCDVQKKEFEDFTRLLTKGFFFTEALQDSTSGPSVNSFNDTIQRTHSIHQDTDPR